MALTNTLMAVTDPGDEVLLVKPYWVSYSEMTKLVNAVPVGIETDKANDFKLTGELLEKYITEKNKISEKYNANFIDRLIFYRENILNNNLTKEKINQLRKKINISNEPSGVSDGAAE